MTLYLIGIGLADEKDITVKGLDIVKKCDVVYLEHYTSILGIDTDTLSKFYGREVIVASRDLVEKQAEKLLVGVAKDNDVALLVVGDVFGATTHTDIMIRAKKAGVNVQTVFNASVLNAIGLVGLELYKYGKTTSIVFPDDDWLPNTPYETIKINKQNGLHTLCLLDIKVAEPTKEEMRRALAENREAKPGEPRYMTVSQGLDVLERLEEKQKEKIITDDMLVVGIARLGHDNCVIKVGPLKEIKKFDFGGPLHSIVIPGNLQVVEEEALERW